MKNITIFGAGLSATALIQYLLSKASIYGWTVTVVDRNMDLLKSKTQNHPHARPLVLDITDSASLRSTLESQDIAISLLPPDLHMLIAEACISSGTHLFTASYVSEEMKKMTPKIVEAGLVFMSELGADPGIDHLSMVKMITELKNQNAQLENIKSMTGALVYPSDLVDCPLKYKFTWNPDNVIRAGENGGSFIQDGHEVDVPYKRLFSTVFPVEVEGIADLYSYYNRASAPYISKYKIPEVKNFLRGTLRYKAFLDAWDVLVQTGLTNSRESVNSDLESVGSIFRKFLKTELAIVDYLSAEYPDRMNEEVYQTIKWLDLDSKEVISRSSIPVYQVLMFHLIPILKLKEEDKDLLIMKHEIEYIIDGRAYLEQATLKCYGKNAKSTAIADTVGLPLAIFTRLFAIGELSIEPGLHIPTDYSLAVPILEELEDYDIKFFYTTDEIQQASEASNS